MDTQSPSKHKRFKLSLWERITGNVTIEVNYGGVIYGIYKVKSEPNKEV